jgi:hypothetical protein
MMKVFLLSCIHTNGTLHLRKTDALQHNRIILFPLIETQISVIDSYNLSFKCFTGNWKEILVFSAKNFFFSILIYDIIWSCMWLPTFQMNLLIIHGSIQSFQNILIKTIASYLDRILHHHLQSSPLGSAHTQHLCRFLNASWKCFFARVFSTICISTWISSMVSNLQLLFSSCGRERSQMEPVATFERKYGSSWSCYWSSLQTSKWCCFC